VSFDAPKLLSPGIIMDGCIVITHMGLGDSINMIGACRYLSIYYTKVILLCSNNHIKNVRLFYEPFNTIEVIGTNTTDYGIEHNYAPEIFQVLAQYPTYDILRCSVNPGLFPTKITHPVMSKMSKEETTMDDIDHECFIAKFYNQIGLDFEIYTKYFNVPYTETAVKLYNMCRFKNYRIAFCHPTGSTASIKIDYKKYDEHDILVVNPSANIYASSDAKYELAEQFVGKPIIDYYLVLRNARYIEIIDSCFVALFFPLSLRKELAATVKICHVRGGKRNYHKIDDSVIYYNC